MGRKDRYETHVKPRLDEVKIWIELLTEEQIAKKLGVSYRSFENYKSKHPELVEALKSGREALVENLKTTLKKKAQGYYYEETKTFVREVDGKTTKTIEKYKKYAQPDLGAIHLLLKNLDDGWRNDDKPTMDLKREQMELAKKKQEEAGW